MSGGGIGGGLGGTLGSILGVALAPETGGLSLAIPAGLGALGGVAGNALGDAVTGEGWSPLGAAESGLAGGVGGGIGGALSGPASVAGGGTAAAAADPFGAGPAFLGGDASLGAEAAGAAPAAGAASSAPAIAPVADPAISGLPIEQQISGELGPSQGALASEPPAGASSAGGPGLGAASPVSPSVSAGGANIDPADAALHDAALQKALNQAAGQPFSSDAGFAGAVGSDVVPGGVPLSGSQALVGTEVGPKQFNSIGDLLGSGKVADTGGLFGAQGPLSGVSSFLKNNSTALGLGGLGLSLGKQALFPPKIPGADQLGANAGLARSIAENFGSGGLNGAQSAASQQALASQISAIKAKYAGMGLSGSTAEQQDIQNAQNANLASQSQAINQNAQTALSALGVSNAPTQAIAQQALQDDKDLSEAIALMAAAGLSGKA